MIAKFSVKKSYTVIVGIVLVIILGIVAYTKMTIDLLPSMELPYAIVMTTYPGASPEAVEAGVTRPIEQSIATVDNVKTIQSQSAENFSIVIIEFDSDANMDTATIDMREKLDQIEGYFDDSVGNPLIMKLNPNMMPVMVATVDKKGADRIELSNYVKEKLSPEIEGVDGVASVTTMGVVEESVQVIIREDKVKDVNKKVKKALDNKFQEAEDKINDAKAQLANGKSQLESGASAANKGFAQAEVEIDNAKLDLLQTESEVNAAYAELLQQEQELLEAKTALEAAIAGLTQLNDAYTGAVANIQALQAMMATADPATQAQCQAQIDALNGAIAQMDAQLAAMQLVDDNGTAITFANLGDYIQGLNANLAQLNEGLAAIAEGKVKLNEAMAQISGGKTQIDEGKILLKIKEAETQSTLTASKVQLEQGEKELEKQLEQFDDAKEAAYSGADMQTIITSDLITAMLTAQNFDFPAGYVTEDDVDYLVRVGNKFSDVDDLSDFVLLDLGMDGLDPIKLSDVADVFIEDDSDSIYTSVNGNPGIMFSIAKQNEYSTKAVADSLKNKFKELEKNDKDLTFTALMDQGLYIDFVANSVIQNLLLGAVLAIIILLLFLKDIRPTGIIAVSIPVSLVFAVVLMYFSGVTLNVISLSGLALGVGMLVDNSIVVIENIYRLRNEGLSVKEAAIKGASQMVGAITASTLTTVCVFLPIVFTSGITKQLFTDMGLTIAYSLLASLIVAITFVPMVASKTFNKVSEKENKLITKISEKYADLLPNILKHKALVFIVVLVLLVVSVALSLSKGFSFIPEMESPQMTMTLTMPEDTKLLEETAKTSDEAINRIMEIDDIQTIGALVSGGSMSMLGLGSNDSVDTVSFYIECKEDKEHTNQEIADMIMEKTKDLDCEISVSTSSMDMSALMTAGVSVRIKGKELDTLQELAVQVGDELSKIKGLEEIDNGIEDATPEYRIVVNKDKAAKYGLTVAQVFQKVQGTLKEASAATTLTSVSKDYSVYVRDEEVEEYNLDDIKKLTIEGKEGEEKVDVKISEIADVEDAYSLSTIGRTNQTRFVSVSAQIKEGYITTNVSNEVKRVVDKMDLPEGYKIEYDGENETVMEAMGQVALMMILAIAFMYLIMVAQFQSLKSPFIIMFTLPLAFTGGFAALFLTGNDVSIIAMIGMVMLAGIIVNNGIVFVDSINQLREEGMDMRTAIITTGKHRLRPIIMTALTTILGLLPMAIGAGMGADMAQPMALVVIGGLTYGTLLTLLVVPCIYEAFNKKGEKKRQMAMAEGEEVDLSDVVTIVEDEVVEDTEE